MVDERMVVEMARGGWMSGSHCNNNQRNKIGMMTV